MSVKLVKFDLFAKLINKQKVLEHTTSDNQKTLCSGGLRNRVDELKMEKAIKMIAKSFRGDIRPLGI